MHRQQKILLTSIVWLLLLIAFTPDITGQQIVHIDSRTHDGRKQGWSGSVAIQANFLQNDNDIFQSFNSFEIAYRKTPYTLLSMSNLDLTLVNSRSLVGAMYQHLRYTRLLSHRFAVEVFSQAQRNESIKLGFRGLVGAGPRVRIDVSDSLAVYVGPLYMYEYEEERGKTAIYRTHRLSTYISFSAAASRSFTLNLIGFYQPNVLNFSDVKLSAETVLEFKVGDSFALNMVYGITHNSRPPEGIRGTLSSFKNGIKFVF